MVKRARGDDAGGGRGGADELESVRPAGRGAGGAGGVGAVGAGRRSGGDRELDAVAARLHTAAIRLLRGLRPVDEASGLSAARLSALSVLVYGGACAIGELAAAEQVSAPTMTRLVAGMEADGVVRRSRDRRDGRSVRVSATARGRRILEAGRRRRVERLARLLSGLSAREVAGLNETIEVLESVLGARGGGRPPGEGRAEPGGGSRGGGQAAQLELAGGAR